MYPGGCTAKKMTRAACVKSLVLKCIREQKICRKTCLCIFQQPIASRKLVACMLNLQEREMAKS